MSSSEEMYKLGVRDAEQDDLNLFYYQHYYYYRQGYDQTRRGNRPPLLRNIASWGRLMVPLLIAFVAVSVVVGAIWLVIRAFGAWNSEDGSVSTASSPGASVVAAQETEETQATQATQEVATPVATATVASEPTIVEPSPTPLPATPVADIESLFMQVGSIVEVVNVGDSPLRGRSNPGLDHPIQTSFSEGARVTIQDGPVDADGYTWWYLEGDEGIGWCAEKSPDGLVWLQLVQTAPAPDVAETSQPETTQSPTSVPVSPTPTPTPEFGLRVGALAKIVNLEDVSLSGRSEPGINSPVVVGFENGIQVTILDGPVPADGYIWWQLESADGTGWSAEGSPDGVVWIEPYEDDTTDKDAADKDAADKDAATEEPTTTATARTSRATATATATATPTPTEPSLHVGSVAVVTNMRGGLLSGRSSPSVDGNIVASFYEGEEVFVLLGPVEADGYTWWRIEGNSGAGWSAEGDDDGTVWLQPKK